MKRQDIVNLALALPGTELQPHFEKISARVGNKVLLPLRADEEITIKLSPVLQEAVIANHPQAIYAVGNNRGRQGRTQVAPRKMLKERA